MSELIATIKTGTLAFEDALLSVAPRGIEPLF
jgi:hypothetical protein